MKPTTRRLPATTSAFKGLVDSKARWLGRRYNLQGADLDDVRQVGYLAALERLGAWDRAVSLSTYLRPYVTYAMLDHCEGLDSGGITGARSAGIHTVSLDTPVGEEPPINDLDEPEAILLEEVLADDAGTPDKVLMLSRLHVALDKLTVPHRNLVSLYYGLTGEKPMTLRQIAARRRTNVTRVYKDLGIVEDRLRELI